MLDLYHGTVTPFGMFTDWCMDNEGLVDRVFVSVVVWWFTLSILGIGAGLAAGLGALQ